MRAKETLTYLEWTDPSGQAQRIYADAIENEQTTLAAEVTTSAVETGAKVTDHYIPEPQTVHLDMYFSGSPSRGDLIPDSPGAIASVELNIPPPPKRGGVLGLTTAVEGALGFGPPPPPKRMSALQFKNPPNQPTKVLALLRGFMAAGTLVTAGTSTAVYENMAITNAQMVRTPDTHDGAKIALDLQQLTFVASDVAIALALPTEPRAQNKKSTSTANTAAEQGDQDKLGVLSSVTGLAK